MSSGSGCVRRIMRLIGNWGRRSLIVGSGRRGGGRGGRMEGVIEWLGTGLYDLWLYEYFRIGLELGKAWRRGIQALFRYVVSRLKE